jgi:hypothetical protein
MLKSSSLLVLLVLLCLPLTQSTASVESTLTEPARWDWDPSPSEWVPHRWRLLGREQDVGGDSATMPRDGRMMLNFTNGAVGRQRQDTHSAFITWVRNAYPPPTLPVVHAPPATARAGGDEGEDADEALQRLYGFTSAIARRHTAGLAMPAGLKVQPRHAAPASSAWERMLERASAAQRGVRMTRRGKKYLGMRVLVIDPFCRWPRVWGFLDPREQSILPPPLSQSA